MWGEVLPAVNNDAPLLNHSSPSLQRKYNMVPHQPMLYMCSEQEILFEVMTFLHCLLPQRHLACMLQDASGLSLHTESVFKTMRTFTNSEKNTDNSWYVSFPWCKGRIIQQIYIINHSFPFFFPLEAYEWQTLCRNLKALEMQNQSLW